MKPSRRPDASAAAADPCARVQARLEQLLDGTLPPLAAALDQGHLEACVACRAEEARWVSLMEALRGAAERPSSELAFARAGLSARIAAAPRPRTSLLRGRLALPLATAAAAMLALFAVEQLSPRLSILDATELRRDVLSRSIELEFPSWDAVLDEVTGGATERLETGGEVR